MAARPARKAFAMEVAVQHTNGDQFMENGSAAQ
jgi:hypothetical protein